ncbi:MAG TPA: DUF4349 domain-containing protein [Puia sp.]|nr:DUF4349 domain-containing protein [Puia sp.]
MRSKYVLAASLLALLAACHSSTKDKSVAERKLAFAESKLLESKDYKAEGRIGILSDNTAVAADSAKFVAGNDFQAGQQQGKDKKQAAAQTSAPQPNRDWDKKMVRTANLQLEVKNYQSFSVYMHDAVKRSGGYISQEEQNQSGYRTEGIVTIRVPVDQFDDAMMRLSSASDSNKVLGKKISTEDVTMEVIDAKSRMEAKREVRARYLELLKQAKKMEDVLNVQNEINAIQEEIEAANGRIAYLGHAAAYSTINLDFYQVLDAGAREDAEPSFFHRLKNSVGNGWEWMGQMIILLTGLWPIWVVLLPVWFGYRKWRSKSRVLPKLP